MEDRGERLGTQGEMGQRGEEARREGEAKGSLHGSAAWFMCLQLYQAFSKTHSCYYGLVTGDEIMIHATVDPVQKNFGH